MEVILRNVVGTLFLLVAAVALLPSCSKDGKEESGIVEIPDTPENPEKPDTLPRGEELYTQVTEELKNFLKTKRGATIEDVQSQLDNYSELVKTEIVNNVMYIKVDNTYEYICDPLGETGVRDSGGDMNSINIEELMNEINKALYPDENVADAGSILVPQSNSGTRSSNDPVMLRKRKMLFWDPFRMNTRLRGFDQIADSKYSLEDLNTLSDYDIAVLFCHGESRYGMMGVPASFRTSFGEDNYLDDDCGVDGVTGTGESCEDIIWIKEAKLRQLIGTNDLSKTIVFMCMCYSDTDKSIIKKILNSHNVAAFAGANEIMDNEVVDFIFNFVNEFYLTRAMASNIIKKEFGSGSSASPIRKSYTTRSGVSGTYSYHYKKDIYYKPLVSAMSAIENQPRASITLPYELATSVSATRNFSPSLATSYGVSMGFWVRNKETGETMEWNFSEPSVELYLRYDYKTMTSRMEVLRVTDDLQDGTYEYKTYLEIDGKKEYSDEMYEFTVKRINNVVPEWILDKIDPYIPIYEGVNPPSIEGLYLMSPMTLNYTSDDSYKPGEIFADHYLSFYDQDMENNTINYYGWQVNGNGSIIGEDLGEGAFISGEGDVFSIFFSTSGESYYEDGTVYSTTALIVSGTKTSSGIKDVYYAFVITSKDDPNDHVMDVGEFRVFIDGDGLAQAIVGDSNTRTRSSQSGLSPMLPSCTDNGNGAKFQKGIPFDVWQKNWSRKMKPRRR